MANFELAHGRNGTKLLTRAIHVASKISREMLIEFDEDQLRLSATSDSLYHVKYAFHKRFFKEYECNQYYSCCVNIKSLSLVFKAPLSADKDMPMNNPTRLQCKLENDLDLQLVFTIGIENFYTLTYRVPINDTDTEKIKRLKELNNDPIYHRILLEPEQKGGERFLLSALNIFAPEIDLVTIIATRSQISFKGSSQKPLAVNNITSEFAHNRKDFTRYDVQELVEDEDDLRITFPIRHLKLYLGFIEYYKSTLPTFIFEGVGQPAHFIYKDNSDMFLSCFSVQSEIAFSGFDDDNPAIEAIANESYIADENIVYANTTSNNLDITFNNQENSLDISEEDGYHENRSDDGLEYLNGDLERGNQTINHSTVAESIRSEMREMNDFDPVKARKILNLDVDCDDDLDMVIEYSSDSDAYE